MSEPLAERFWRRVNKAGPVPDHRPEIGECHEWTGSMANGYGKLNRQLAHRVAWALENGPIKAGLFVCHHCDNPKCVRAAHLFLGTARDNSDDKFAKGRGNTGERNGAAKGSDEEIEQIRILWATGAWLQRELAAKFGRNQSSISDIVRGIRRVGTNVRYLPGQRRAEATVLADAAQARLDVRRAEAARPRGPALVKAEPRLCQTAGCGRVHSAKGFCARCYAQAFADQGAARSKAHRAAFPEKHRAWYAQWSTANKERRRKSAAEWRARHKALREVEAQK